MKILNVLAAIAVASILSGCAATGALYVDPPPPNPGQGRIFVYRPHTDVSQMGGPAIDIDGSEQGKLLNEGYLVAYVPAGVHRVTAKGNIWNWNFKDFHIDVNVVAGASQYVRFMPYIAGTGTLGASETLKFASQMAIVDEDGGHREIIECKAIDGAK